MHRSRRSPRPLALLVVGALALTACGPRFDGAVYRGADYAFRVGPIPPTWERVSAPSAALAFRDPATESTVAVGMRCGADAEDIPLRALTQHLFLLFTERRVELEEVVPFDGREALHTVLSAKLDGVAKAFDVWVLKKDGCVADLYAISPPERRAAFAPVFQAFVRGFAVVPRHAE